MKRRGAFAVMAVAGALICVAAYIALVRGGDLVSAGYFHQMAPNSNAASAPGEVLTKATQGQRVTAAVPIRQPLTEDRRRIFDSGNLLATIYEVESQGTADEKDWALAIISTCITSLYEPMQDPTPPDSGQKAIERPHFSPEVEVQRTAAREALSQRCKGIKGLTAEARNGLKDRLRRGVEGNPSDLAKLSALTTNALAAWTPSQAALVSSSLYSSDPIVARAAYFALISEVDVEAAGGADRLAAMNLALAPSLVNKPLSEFERLEVCLSLGNCDPDWVPPGGDAPGENVSALVRKYRQAFAAHLGARELLAVR